MNLWGQAMVLGILQGLTEFLPISSSAHLLVLPWLLGWKPLGLTFDVVLHVGTLLALLVYFRHEWRALGLRCLSRWSGRSNQSDALPDALILGTLPALLAGGLGQDFISRELRSPLVTVVTLSLFGILLGWADRAGRQARRLTQIGRRDGLLIGLAQALALIPGVSRSGVTITAALFLGLTRPDSARFSFLLSTPLIALAAAARLYRLLQSGPEGAALAAPLLLGVIFSFASGFLCIKYFLRFLATRTYFPFVVYRLLLAVFIFALLGL